MATYLFVGLGITVVALAFVVGVYVGAWLALSDMVKRKQIQLDAKRRALEELQRMREEAERAEIKRRHFLNSSDD